MFLPEFVLRDGNLGRIGGMNHPDQLFRMGVGQGIEQYGVYDGEDGRSCADPQGEQQDRGAHIAGALPDRTNGIAKVLRESADVVSLAILPPSKNSLEYSSLAEHLEACVVRGRVQVFGNGQS